jgi:hypothetical protein
VPNTVRNQLTSSVDFAPLLLSLADESDSWRNDPRYLHLSTRANIARIVADPSAPGRQYAVHATDEVLTEFALLPHAAGAPLHVKGIVTPTAKYATYSHWRANTLDALSRGEQAELYDYTSRGGYHEIDNRAGRSPLEDQLRASLDEATHEELHRPLPSSLVAVQERALAEYHLLAERERVRSELSRLNHVERIVRDIERTCPERGPLARRRGDRFIPRRRARAGATRRRRRDQALGEIAGEVASVRPAASSAATAT